MRPYIMEILLDMIHASAALLSRMNPRLLAFPAISGPLIISGAGGGTNA